MAIIQKDYELQPGAHNENMLRVTLDYSLGGTNWFSGGYEKRGYFLYCIPCERKARPFNDGTTYTTVSETVGKGAKILLKEVSRKSNKAEAEAVEIAKEKESYLINTVLTRYGLKLKAE